MINLIPVGARKRVVQEYWLRVVTVGFFAGAICLTMLATLQAPTYVMVTSLESALHGQIDGMKSRQKFYDDLDAKTNEANSLISHLAAERGEERSLSDHLYMLDTIAGDGVNINKFTLNPVGGVLESITVIGVAETRTTLAEFRDALEAAPLYSDVELPISNLAKERDIVFTLSMTVSESES